MKNLKKILCLVLALVMVLGMAVSTYALPFDSIFMNDIADALTGQFQCRLVSHDLA